MANGKRGIEKQGEKIALYHAVFENEDFDKAASDLMELVRASAKSHPGVTRVLFLDIDGHRNSQGGFDGDMFELQHHFVLECLIGRRLITQVTQPLGSVRIKGVQSEDVPDSLVIAKTPAEATSMKADMAARGVTVIPMGESGG